MDKNNNDVRKSRSKSGQFDATDRKLLRYLAQDATRSFAELGELLNLSPPAVHERMKKLKRDGVIEKTVAVLNGEKLGRGILSFIQVRTIGWAKDKVAETLEDCDSVEEVHAVSDDFCMMLKVRTPDLKGMEDIMRKISRLEGVSNANAQIVLTSYFERCPMPQDEDRYAS